MFIKMYVVCVKKGEDWVRVTGLIKNRVDATIKERLAKSAYHCDRTKIEEEYVWE